MAITPNGGVYRPEDYNYQIDSSSKFFKEVPVHHANEGELNEWQQGPQQFDPEPVHHANEGELNEWMTGPQHFDEDYLRDSSKSDRGIEGSETYNMGSTANPRNASGEYLSEIVASGRELTEEEINQIYTTIMYGTQSPKQLSDNIAALINSGRDDLINNIIQNQAQLSVEQMKQQKNGYVDLTVDRNYQFMKTLITLKELGYDLNGMSFKKGEDQTVDFIKFMGDYSKQCAENNATMSEKIQSQEVNERISSSPELISANFVEEEFVKNPQRFEQEYQSYLASKKEGEFRISYEEFIRNRYHIEINRLQDKLKMFQEERDKIIAADKEKRMQMFNGQNLGQVEEEIQDLENKSSERGR